MGKRLTLSIAGALLLVLALAGPALAATDTPVPYGWMLQLRSPRFKEDMTSKAFRYYALHYKRQVIWTDDNKTPADPIGRPRLQGSRAVAPGGPHRRPQPQHLQRGPRRVRLHRRGRGRGRLHGHVHERRARGARRQALRGRPHGRRAAHPRCGVDQDRPRDRRLRHLEALLAGQAREPGHVHPRQPQAGRRGQDQHPAGGRRLRPPTRRCPTAGCCSCAARASRRT